MGVDIGGALTRAFIKNIFLLVHPDDRSAPSSLQAPSAASCPRFKTQSTSISLLPTNSPSLDIALQRSMHAKTIVMRVLYSVMASAHALERFWNGSGMVSVHIVWWDRSGTATFAFPFYTSSVGNSPVHTVISERSRMVGTVQTLQCERSIK